MYLSQRLFLPNRNKKKTSAATTISTATMSLISYFPSPIMSPNLEVTSHNKNYSIDHLEKLLCNNITNQETTGTGTIAVTSYFSSKRKQGGE